VINRPTDQSSTHWRAVPLITAALFAFACRGTQSAQHVAVDERADWFIDRAADAGLDFTHFNGMSGAAYYAEHMGAGVALFDYDNDGDLDVFLVQGQMLGAGKTLKDALFPPKDGKPIRGRLYRNDLETRPDGSRVSHFTDVTESSGINANGYGIGAAAATSTTTGASICMSRRSDATSCFGTTATAPSRTCRRPAASTTLGGAAPLRFSTTTGTGGLICSSAIT